MKNRIYLSVLLLCLISVLPAQKIFMNTYGGADEDATYQVVLTPEGNILTVGYENAMDNTSNFYGRKIYLNWFDTDGNLISAKAMGLAITEKGYGIMPTSDGGYIVCSEGKYVVNANCGTDAYLVKMDAQGNKIWAKGIGGLLWDDVYSSVEIPGGDYVILGNTASYGNGNFDAYLMRLKANGDTVWSSTYGSISAPMSAQETARQLIYFKGALYACGTIYHESDAKFYPWVFKTDLGGNLIWSKMLNTNVTVSSAFGITFQGDDVVIYSGNRLTKIDTSGVLKSLIALPVGFVGQYGNPYFGNITQTQDGGLVLCGGMQSKACMIKVDSAMQISWVQVYPDVAYDASFATSIIELPDGRIAMGGLIYKNNMNDSRLWVTKPDGSLGTCSQVQTFTPGTASGTLVNAPTVAMRTGFLMNSNVAANAWTIPASEFTLTDRCQAPFVVQTSVQTAYESQAVYGPNPVFNNFRIQEIQDIPLSVQVYNLEGKLIPIDYLLTTHHTLELNMETLKPGVYIVRVLQSSGNLNLRVIKE